VRETKSYGPYVPTRHPDMNVVVVRENEEDLYAGIEHRQTREVRQALKLITRPGTERIVRFAFAYARAYGRRKVTCMTKDNIMKLTDGLFHKVFDAVAAEHPEIEAEHLIVDIGAAKLADTPEDFDVIVTLNLYGDILSDVDRPAGRFGRARRARPTSATASRCSRPSTAARPTSPDAASPTRPACCSRRCRCSSTSGRPPWPSGSPTPGSARSKRAPLSVRTEKKALVGVDVFIDHAGADPERLARRLQALVVGPLRLEMISNRGMRIWPEGLPETSCVDVFRCRFRAPEKGDTTTATHAQVTALLQNVERHGLEWVKTELLYTFDGQPGFSRSQGG
jgi:isocitrate dehydrogenase